MQFEVESNLAAVERSVSLTERDGQPARAITIARSFATSVEDLWDAVTSADRIPRWFLPISGELELGGRFQLEGNAGGSITSCERPSHFSLTWEFAGEVSWVSVGISAEEGGGARLTLTHTALLSEHWETYGAGATGVGWEMALLGVEMHVTDPDEPKPDPEAFAASADGKALLTGSSEGWGEASIAAGTDPEAARAAARQTTAFYTGEPVVDTD